MYQENLSKWFIIYKSHNVLALRNKEKYLSFQHFSRDFSSTLTIPSLFLVDYMKYKVLRMIFRQWMKQFSIFQLTNWFITKLLLHKRSYFYNSSSISLLSYFQHFDIFMNRKLFDFFIIFYLISMSSFTIWREWYLW